jgi:ribosomal protein S18 acetylase RimI-like enzyme
MVQIRLMTPADSDAIAQLDVLAFAAHARRAGYESPIPPRTPQNLLACQDLNPAGCFVAKAGELVGFVFARTWGTTGWIGTFGVHPDCQGQGVGSSLLAAAGTQLRKTGCTTIGLETMSDSPDNVGFYGRFGFLPAFPTVLLIKRAQPMNMDSSYTALSQVENCDALSAIAQISHAAQLGLNYAPEVSNAIEHGWGEALFLGWPQPWAFALVRTEAKREGLAERVADVEALVALPGVRQQLIEALHAIELFVVKQGFEQLTLAVNAVDGDAFQQALGFGYRVRNVVLRMILGGECSRPVGMVLSKWLM